MLSDQYFGQTRAVVDPPADIGLVERAPEGGAQGRRATSATPSPRPASRRWRFRARRAPRTRPTVWSTTSAACPRASRATTSGSSTSARRSSAQFDYGERWADIEGEGDLAVVTFGSCTGAAREALARAAAEGIKARLVSLRLLSPSRPERLAKALAGAKRVLVVEQNHTGQLYRYLRAEYDLPGEVKSFRHPGPLPMRPDEIHQQITEWSRS